MIYSRFGSVVKKILIRPVEEDGWITVEYEDGRVREVHVTDLRADGGIKEIMGDENEQHS